LTQMSRLMRWQTTRRAPAQMTQRMLAQAKWQVLAQMTWLAPAQMTARTVKLARAILTRTSRAAPLVLPRV
ncbi:MAG TPA: hypothetical protein VN541_17190, partial [Tepidisphaeraceae bacterium]|nr:hypothetical protein [Tepidisphaeraceae bacterium]